MRGTLTSFVLAAALLAGGCSRSTAPSAPAGLAGTWYDSNGGALPDGSSAGALVLRARLGPEQCDFGSIVIMDLAWPIGTRSTYRPGTFNEYVRDAQGVIGDELRTGFAANKQLPPSALDTGSTTIRGICGSTRRGPIRCIW
jgi:hypothetical protein